jgi:hypothetical protein
MSLAFWLAGGVTLTELKGMPWNHGAAKGVWW